MSHQYRPFITTFAFYGFTVLNVCAGRNMRSKESSFVYGSRPASFAHSREKRTVIVWFLGVKENNASNFIPCIFLYAFYLISMAFV
jgi:hypothetical protein